MPTPSPEPTGRAAPRHDVFISYSHSQTELARSLKKSLESFSRRWYERRGRHVFLDEASIPTGAYLEESVVEALYDSSAFLLIASEAAGRSQWVNRELEFWIAKNGTRNLYIVLADGAIVWDRRRKRFDAEASTALPEAVMSAFAEEPLWEDLTNLEPGTREDRILSVTAGLISAISGSPKDQVYGESIRQQRLVKRIAVTVAAIMSLLVTSLIVVSVAAIQQSHKAKEAQNIANAHALATSARGLLQSRLSSAMLQSLAAHGMHDDLYTRASLLQSLSYDPHLLRFLRTRDFIHGLAWDGGSRRIMTWAQSSVSVYDVASGSVLYLNTDGDVNCVLGSANGSGDTIAVGTSTGVVDVFSATTGSKLWSGTVVKGTKVSSLSFDASGTTVAAASSGGISLFSLDDGTVLAHRSLASTLLSGSIAKLAFTHDGSQVVLLDSNGRTLVLSATDLADTETGKQRDTTTNGQRFLVSTDDGTWLASFNKGSVAGKPITGRPTVPSFTKKLPRSPGAFALSDDGQIAAIERNGFVTIYHGKEPDSHPRAPIHLPGAGTFGSILSISPDNRYLASSYGRRIGIWSLDQYSGIARTMNLVVSPPSSGGRQTLLPDSKTGTAVMLASNPFAPASAANNHLLCWNQSTGQSTPVEHSFRGIVTALAWNRDHSAVLLATKSPSAIRRLPVDNGCPVGPGSVLATVAAKNAAITAVAALADSTLLALVPGQGLYRFGLNGHVIQTWGGGGPDERQVLSFAVSPDGRSILMGHDGGLVEQYALEAGHVVHEWSEPDGTGKVGSVTFLSYGLVAASKGEGNVYLINGSNGEVVKQLGGAQGFVLSSAGKGALLIGTEPGYQLAVWDMPTGLLMTRFTYSHSVEPLTGPARRASMLTSVVEDEDGNTWFGAAGAYVARWDLDPYRWNGTACTLLHGLPAPNFVQPSAISEACSG